MVMFNSESELVKLLDRADALIASCVDGSLEFRAFYRELGDLHGYHALDGHESDHEEQVILDLHRDRIAWIERVLDEVGKVCADEDATKEAYIKCGRFGSAEALNRLRRLAAIRAQSCDAPAGSVPGSSRV
eukprot:TRINITY_DN101230_c0_g1_i1.p1 TRINITY_DN101230_c0_g1~~TRINITY_DN101230_c0_g1_i1.p1  ORF type:complete len:131 (-),score=14.33 TRINITY_DN101230_c0_g1_i1:42-434(-)